MRTFALAWVVVAPGWAAALDGPRAEFGIDADGFLTVRVTHDGTEPLPCRVRAVMPSGHVWAEGRTAADGTCEFPCPRAGHCRIEFDLAGTPSPPVELTFLDDGTAVVPLVAPLTPGPCCVGRPGPPPSPAPPPAAETGWAGYAAATVFLALGVLAGLARWSPARTPKRMRRSR